MAAKLRLTRETITKNFRIYTASNGVSPITDNYLSVNITRDDNPRHGWWVRFFLAGQSVARYNVTSLDRARAVAAHYLANTDVIHARHAEIAAKNAYVDA